VWRVCPRWREAARERPYAFGGGVIQPLSSTGIPPLSILPMPEEGMVLDASPTRHGVRPSTLLALAVLLRASGQMAYDAMREKLGYPQRDRLVNGVQQARDSQQAAKA